MHEVEPVRDGGEQMVGDRPPARCLAVFGAVQVRTGERQPAHKIQDTPPRRVPLAPQQAGEVELVVGLKVGLELVPAFSEESYEAEDSPVS